MRADLHILDYAAVLDDALLAYRAIESPPRVERLLGYLAELFEQLPIVAVLGPQVRIAGCHAVERHDAAPAGLVYQIHNDPDFPVLTFLDDAVAELGVVGRVHLVDVQQDHVVADDVVRQVTHVVNGRVVTNVARDNPAVRQSHRNVHVVVFQIHLFQAPYADKPVELAVLHVVGVELVAYQDVIPAVGRVAVLYEDLDLIRPQRADAIRQSGRLDVAKVILVPVRRQIRGRYKVVPERTDRHHPHFFHVQFPLARLSLQSPLVPPRSGPLGEYYFGDVGLFFWIQR